MNQIVPSLYEGLNLNTLPKIIKETFYKLGNSKNPFDGKPLSNMYTFKNENINFFYEFGQAQFFFNLIEKKKLLDECGNLLSRDAFHNVYLLEYGRGFQKGYYQFEKSLKPENPLFEIDNKQIIHKVFSRAVKNTSFKTPGAFPISFVSPKEIIELNKNHQTENLNCLKKDAYSKNGYEGGEFYKAWSIILQNPTLFEGVFIKHFEDAKIKKPLLENIDINSPKEFDYTKIGVLIAQGKLTKAKKGYEYKNNTYDKIELEKELKKDLNIKSIRQYIEGTFGVDAESTYKNDLRRNQTKIKKIVEYCVYYKKPITEQYQKLFDELE